MPIAIVLDFHAIAEGAEKVLVTFHKPDLQEVLTYEILSFQLQDFVHESDLVIDGFLLQKDEAQVASLSERGKSGLVEIALFSAHPTEHVYDDGGIDFFVDEVSFHRRLRWEEKLLGEGMGCKRESASIRVQCCLAQHTFFQRFLGFDSLRSCHERFRDSFCPSNGPPSQCFFLFRRPSFTGDGDWGGVVVCDGQASAIDGGVDD